MMQSALSLPSPDPFNRFKLLVVNLNSRFPGGDVFGRYHIHAPDQLVELIWCQSLQTAADRRLAGYRGGDAELGQRDVTGVRTVIITELDQEVAAADAQLAVAAFTEDLLRRGAAH